MGFATSKCEFHLVRRCCAAGDYHARPHTFDCPDPIFDGPEPTTIQWCTRCQSLSHSSEQCPRGFADNPIFEPDPTTIQWCTRCQSLSHSTEQCPRGFADKPIFEPDPTSIQWCTRCQSLNHSSEQCPRGFADNPIFEPDPTKINNRWCTTCGGHRAIGHSCSRC